MYTILLTAHSIVRWAVVISLTYSIIAAIKGYYYQKASFSKTHDSIRHWTATICHIQLMLGIILYTQSPLIKYYFNTAEKPVGDAFFFSILHIILMLLAIVIITIGSAKAKREALARDKYKTMALWFALGFILILIAIPWPFSPLSSRPLIRIS